MTTESAYVSDDDKVIFSSHPAGKPAETITVQGITYRLTEGGVCRVCRFTVAKVRDAMVHTDPAAPTDHTPELQEAP